jgi:hypothetical protein
MTDYAGYEDSYTFGWGLIGIVAVFIVVNLSVQLTIIVLDLVPIIKK